MGGGEMKSKQLLSIKQMQHLKELGLDTTNASMCWIKTPKGRDMAFNDEWINRGESILDPVPAYTLQDILEILPSTIGEGEDYCYLEITAHGKGESRGYVIQYHNPEEDCDYNIAMDKELIEAAYQELLICIEGNSVNTRKEKQQ